MSYSNMEEAATLSTPEVSIVIPGYNEAEILHESLVSILKEFKALDEQIEIVVCENGSTDNSLRIAEQLQQAHSQIRAQHLPTSNYGLALKHGISACRGNAVIIFNIDFWSLESARIALAKLGDYDMVIGSKTMEGAKDQ